MDEPVGQDGMEDDGRTEGDHFVEIQRKPPPVRNRPVRDILPIDFVPIKDAIQFGYKAYEDEKIRMIGNNQPTFLFKVMKYCPGSEDSALIFQDIIETLTVFCAKVGLNYEANFREEIEEISSAIGHDYEFFVAFVNHCTVFYISFQNLFIQFLSEEKWLFAEYLLFTRRLSRISEYIRFIDYCTFDKFLKIEAGIGTSFILDDFTRMFINVNDQQLTKYIYNTYLINRKHIVYDEYGLELNTYLMERSLFNNDLPKVLFLLEQNAVPSTSVDLEDFIFYLIRKEQDQNDVEAIDTLIETLHFHFGESRVLRLIEILSNHVYRYPASERRLDHWLTRIREKYGQVVPN